MMYYACCLNIDQDIEFIIKSCESCQLNKNDPDKHSSHGNTLQDLGNAYISIIVDLLEVILYNLIVVELMVNGVK